MRNEKTKTIKFNMDNEEDRELWEWLQTKPHGFFSMLTKLACKDAMERSVKIDENKAKSNEGGR